VLHDLQQQLLLKDTLLQQLAAQQEMLAAEACEAQHIRGQHTELQVRGGQTEYSSGAAEGQSRLAVPPSSNEICEEQAPWLRACPGHLPAVSVATCVSPPAIVFSHTM
jgi:hypothetical protein